MISTLRPLKDSTIFLIVIKNSRFKIQGSKFKIIVTAICDFEFGVFELFIISIWQAFLSFFARLPLNPFLKLHKIAEHNCCHQKPLRERETHNLPPTSTNKNR